MEYSNQTQIILDSLGRDRKDLADKLSEIDKLVKSIKLGCYNLGETTSAKSGVLVDVGETVDNTKPFPLKADLKVQVLKVIDALGVASKLKDIQDKLFELSKERPNIRETVRTLNKHTNYSNYFNLKAQLEVYIG